MLSALSPLKLGSNNLPVVDYKNMQTTHPQVWCGGDIAGVAETTVESVNDGKIAAWYMHCHLEVIYDFYILQLDRGGVMIYTENYFSKF